MEVVEESGRHESGLKRGRKAAMASLSIDEATAVEAFIVIVVTVMFFSNAARLHASTVNSARKL